MEGKGGKGKVTITGGKKNGGKGNGLVCVIRKKKKRRTRRKLPESNYSARQGDESREHFK